MSSTVATATHTHTLTPHIANEIKVSMKPENRGLIAIHSVFTANKFNGIEPIARRTNTQTHTRTHTPQKSHMRTKPFNFFLLLLFSYLGDRCDERAATKATRNDILTHTQDKKNDRSIPTLNL